MTQWQNKFTFLTSHSHVPKACVWILQLKRDHEIKWFPPELKTFKEKVVLNYLYRTTIMIWRGLGLRMTRPICWWKELIDLNSRQIISILKESNNKYKTAWNTNNISYSLEIYHISKNRLKNLTVVNFL